jgi:predicted nucleic acid-binding protein
VILADTGAVFALLDRDDAWHARVAGFWERNAGEIQLPETILAEVTHLLATRIGPRAESLFIRALADGEFLLDPFLADDNLARVAELVRQYESVALGFVDASLVAAAERGLVTTLLTTDRRHFPAVWPRHTPSFRLEP